MLGLREAFKEDLKTSPAQLLYGTELRIPGEFSISDSVPAEPNFFLENFREHMRRVRPTTTAHHTTARFFMLKDLYECSHVFVRVDTVKKPLNPPYTGPHEVVTRVDERVFVVRVNGHNKVISIDGLKPAFIAKSDSEQRTEQQQQQSPQSSPLIVVPEEHRSINMDPLLTTYAKVAKTTKKVPFPSLPGQVTGRGVVVAAEHKPDSIVTDGTRQQRQRRKQTLVPRTD
ncbi:uncharacterized protein LOC107044038 [Diachasma alloeum]|uniref:uncharacterized protein LOC107044038 n=1 Tax=Diachasma alloeum TaxID=454923 RepID=UPI0007383AC1|nr:uncharacterized protein LOC107044038 [Diachasma alloeum]